MYDESAERERKRFLQKLNQPIRDGDIRDISVRNADYKPDRDGGVEVRTAELSGGRYLGLPAEQLDGKRFYAGCAKDMIGKHVILGKSRHTGYFYFGILEAFDKSNNQILLRKARVLNPMILDIFELSLNGFTSKMISKNEVKFSAEVNSALFCGGICFLLPLSEEAEKTVHLLDEAQNGN